MKILSINFNHDGAGCILEDGRVSSFVCTERFSRIKKHTAIRAEELALLLRQSGYTLNEIDHVVLANLNLFGFEEFLKVHGTTLEETWLDFRLNKSQDRVTLQGVELPCSVDPPHQRAHAALAYYASPFSSAMVFTWDPTGQGVFVGRGNKLMEVPELIPHFRAASMYCWLTQLVFQTSLMDSGKMMGLAPYGYERDIDLPFQIDIDTTVTYNVFAGLRERKWDDAIWVDGAGGKRWNATLAYYAQCMIEETLSQLLTKLYAYAIAHGIEPNLVLSGGGALNSVANEKAFSRSAFERLYIHPACGDDGTAIGAALDHFYVATDAAKKSMQNAEVMYSRADYQAKITKDIEDGIERAACIVEEGADYISRAANLIAQGKIVGWFQGASELGPRALGNRSIVADPRRSDMKDVLNARVKFREAFRPFAPSILNEYAREWFGIEDAPFMLRVAEVRKPGVPAVTHVDGSARVQTVARVDNQAFYDLISLFHAKTGVPLVVNTSFNVKGEPIVETPADALQCFLRTGIDALVFPNTIVMKREES